MCFIFALFGLKLWIGLLRGRCLPASMAVGALELVAGQNSSVRELQHLYDPGGLRYTCCPDPVECPTATCDVTEVCVNLGNPKAGHQSFDNIGSAILIVFQAMTAEGWTEVMDRLLDVSSGSIVAPYLSTPSKWTRCQFMKALGFTVRCLRHFPPSHFPFRCLLNWNRYFSMLMIFGGLFVTNYLLAECCVVFTSHIENLKLMKGDLQMIAEKKKV